VFALLAFAAFMLTAFRTGWTQLSTDFPNYYTAAVLARHREPLRDYYDWTWFARQMNYAGIENQIGAYTPQPPLNMLPMIPIAGLTPLTAKRVWMAINLALLALVIGMLARTARIRWEYISILVFCGYRSIDSNFLYGQYYVFLLFLMTLIVYWLEKRHDGASGFLSGVTFGLKLYTGPLLVYFAAKRKWRSVLGMLAGSACLGALAIAMFGWSDLAYYLTHVLPRTLEGGSVDPYTPGTSTLSNLLRRQFIREPELNPNPPFDAPWLFFFARTAMQLGLIVFATLGVASKNNSDRRRDLAWFLIMLVLLSTSTASYTYVLLLAPIVLLLENASLVKSAYLVITYILLNIDLHPAWIFPKVCLLLLLYSVVGAEYWRSVRWSWAICAGVAVLSLAALDATNHMSSYMREPGRRYPQIAVERSALFSGYPVITRYGLFYQGLGADRQGSARYVLRWLRNDRIGTLLFDGNALDPVAEPGGQIRFELVANRGSTFMRFDPPTGTTVAIATPPTEGTQDAVASPDGKWAVLTRWTPTSEELWLKDIASGRMAELAGGNCNNSSPAWELDSSAIVFSSDCDRAYGLPALYRAPIIREIILKGLR
jgi:hypothetical protein